MEINLKALRNVGSSDTTVASYAKCWHCFAQGRDGQIIERFTKTVIRITTRYPDNISIKSIYFCENCGTNFTETPKNKLGTCHQYRLEKAEMLFQETRLDSLNKDLTVDEIVVGSEKEGELLPDPFVNASDFTKNTEVLYYKANKADGGYLNKICDYPHIVNDKKGKRMVGYKSNDKIPLPPIAILAARIYHPILEKDFWIPFASSQHKKEK